MANLGKKFIASIYLHNKQAVKGLDDKTVVDADPVELACKYSDSNVDEILVFDMSEGGSDADHEASLDIIKDISKSVDVDVTGCGNVKRMEDIKKLLYAGCKKACVDFSKQGNVDILQEVSEKFGKEKIGITCTDLKELTDNQKLAEEFASEVILMAGKDTSKVRLADSSLPVTVLFDEGAVSGDAVTVLEEYDYVAGVTGNLVNCSIDKVNEYKDICISKNIPICRLEAAISWDELKKNSDGLIPVIVQDYRTDQVLMLAYMNEEAYNKTQTTGKMTYFSRSRSSLWLKGETSGHFQYVKALYADCDKDTILAKVKQIGAACHTGSYSCFFNEIARKDYTEKNPQKVLDSVFDVIKDRQVNPKVGSYTNYLFDKGIDKILKKVGEEATEMVIAAKNPNSNEIVYEMSDFLYHMMVLMAEKNISWEEITDELSRR